MNYCVKIKLSSVLALFLSVAVLAEEVGDRWGTEKREREYYRVVSIPMPKGQVIEAGAFELMPDNRLAVGTRRGDIFFVKGIDEDKPRPQFHQFADGLDEIFGLAHDNIRVRASRSPTGPPLPRQEPQHSRTAPAHWIILF
jgi:hypothetical protein